MSYVGHVEVVVNGPPEDVEHPVDAHQQQHVEEAYPGHRFHAQVAGLRLRGHQ